MEDQRRPAGDSDRGVDDRGTADRGTRDLFAAPDDKPGKKPGKTPPPAKVAKTRAAVRDIRLHLYLSMPQTPDEFVEYLNYSWDKTGIGPFDLFGVTFTKLTNAKQGIDEFKKSLSYSGTIAVYMGHTSLVPKKGKTKPYVAQGLDPPLSKKILSNAALVALLEKASANIVILAGCATDACVPKKLKNDVIVITTASGADGTTNSAFWAQALTAFLLALAGWDFDGKTVTQRSGGTATVKEAIEAGNKFFPKGESFVLASGDGSIREF
jgi:hypothetical protein